MGRSFRRLNWPCFVGLALTFASSTHAQTGPEVEVLLTDCASEVIDAPSVLELLRVELREHGVERVVLIDNSEPRDHAEIPRLTLSASCDDPMEVHVRVDRGKGTRTSGLTVDLRNVADAARSRTLAMTAGELWQDPTAKSSESPPKDTPAPTIRAPEPTVIRVVENRWLAPAKPRDPDTWLGVAIGARTTESGGTLAAGWLLGSHVIGSSLRLRLEASVQNGSGHSPLGDIHVRGLAGSLGVVGASRGTVFALEIGPLLEVGYGWMKGEPAGPDVLGDQGSGPTVNVVLDAIVRARFRKGVWLGTGLQTGYVLYGLEPRVEGTPVYGTRGAMLGLRMLVGGEAW
jgi:hypothetical protein